MAKEASMELKQVAETLRMLQDNLQCSICIETLQDPATTRCGHTFCQLCINQIAKGRNAVCPLCKTRITRRGIYQNEKIQSVVKAVHVLISSAEKDAAENGQESAWLSRKECKSSTKESFSPPGRSIVAATPEVVKQPKIERERSSRVESWLLGVAPTITLQESSPELNSPSADSDCEMVSVSQVDPDQSLKHQTSKSKPLSAYIEEDPEDVSIKMKSSKIKSIIKPLSSRKFDLSRAKPKQESNKNCLSRAKHNFNAACNASNSETIEMSVPEPVLVVLNGEKENSVNALPSRSPGWSRVQKMKKDFDQPSKGSKAVNSKGKEDARIEDAFSGDELPCLSLSINSPYLRNKAKQNEVLSNLELEIQVLESQNTSVNRKENKGSGTSKSNPPVESQAGISCHKPVVRFVKLGSVNRRSPSVPIYLKGPLEHLQCTDISLKPHRLFVDAQIQTSPEKLINAEDASLNQVMKTPDSLRPMRKTPDNIFKSPSTRRSGGVLSDSDFDMMDAETVLFTQQGRSGTTSKLNNKNAGNNPLVGSKEARSNDTEEMDTEIVQIPCIINECTEDTQASASVICSQERSPQKIHSIASQDVSQVACTMRSPERNHQNVEGTSPEVSKSSQQSASIVLVSAVEKVAPISPQNSQVVSQVNIDSSSSSSSIDERKSKKVPLHSSSDSSDSEIGVSRNSTNKRKRKKLAVSDNEDSCPNDLNISAVDTMKIMANIKDQLDDDDLTCTPDWFVDARKKVEDHVTAVSEAFSEPVDVFDTSRNGTDSDGDSEFINPTPQKRAELVSRSASGTQSSDIVPSSQPLDINQKLPPTSFQISQRDAISTLEGSVDCQSNAPVLLNREQLPCEGDNYGKDDSASEPFLTAPQAILSDAPQLESSKSDPPVVPNSPAAKPVFVCSSIPPNLVSQVEKLAGIVGGEFSPRYTNDTTHLIVRVDESNKADKTLKYLCAVAAGKWVISFAWVQKCLEAKKLLLEEPFEALDTTGEPGPRRSREARLAQKKLFGGFEFCCVGEFQDLSKQQLEELLIESGATVVPKPTEFSFKNHTIIPITLAQYEEEKDYSSWINNFSVPLVMHEWVLDCIGKFRVTSFYASLLCEAPDETLAAMGIPTYLFEYVDSE